MEVIFKKIYTVNYSFKNHFIMRTIIIFSLCSILGIPYIFAQSTPVVVSPITDGFTVSFSLPPYTLRNTTLTALFNTNEIFKYIQLDDFGIIDDVGYPQLPQYSFDLHVPAGASVSSSVVNL